MITRRSALIFIIVFASAIVLHAQKRTGPQVEFTITAVKGIVEVSRARAQTFDKVGKGAPLHGGDRVRVGPDSELAIQHTDKSVYTFAAKSEFMVSARKPPATSGPTVRLLSGLLYFLHRGRPGFFEVETQTASAAVRGTEFNLAVDEAGVTVITMIDGLVDLKNEVDTVAVKSGEVGVAEPGKAPVVRPATDIDSVIQWTLYYPAILDTDEIPLSDAERDGLTASLAAYRAGDLLRALNEYPRGRTERSSGEKIYLAGLKLAVSQVDDAELLLKGADGEVNSRLAAALRVMIDAVRGTTAETDASPTLASEWMAESYRLQAQVDLIGALQAARNVTVKSPAFGFGWSRVAELEFSFGRIDAAASAIAKALEISPANAQAVALNGFLLAARNRMTAAIGAFDRAIEIDPGLANGWLGRGLCLIRTGDTDRGREDLLMAAAQEPQRASLRSYLGKAWADDGEAKLAEDELKLAKEFDPRDPTAWLYSALLKAQNNRINEAIGDLEHAQTLNTNRAVYRSEFLLDQDRAVRSVNLAKIYRDAGMTEWSVREAGRAVAADYGNYSAHLFLANSYDQLQDPYRINLRYETATESEYLIANLLAPVGAGILSQSVSQGEYSSLFERNRFGVASTTEYLSRGAWYENGAQFGVFGNTAYSIEGIYRSDPGQRVNNDFEERDLRFQIKQQLTYKDSVLFRIGWLERSGGDLLQYHDQRSANTEIRTHQRQEPTVTVGYHREWSPGVHTLVLAGRVDDNYWVDNPSQPAFLIVPDPAGIVYVEPVFAQQRYRSSTELYTAEAQQIWQTEHGMTVFGSRFQRGAFLVGSDQINVIGHPNGYVFSFIGDKTYIGDFDLPFERFSVYGYHHWRLHDQLLIVAGLSYDRIVHPKNFRAAPLSDARKRAEEVSPKAGFLWTPGDRFAVRGAYARTITGASVDQSYLIEPTQVAGFNQSFRSLVSESVAGSDIGARQETFALSIEKQFPTGTHLAISGELSYSKNRRALGVFAADSTQLAVTSSFQENIDYREMTLTFAVDQIISRDWTIGASYRIVESRLEDSYPDVASVAQLVEPFQSRAQLRATLQQVDISLNFNHWTGIFAESQAVLNQQNNDGVLEWTDEKAFWQFHVIGGYRFFKRRAELAVGVLNVTGQDYQLHPLTPYLELPRERTFMARARLAF